MEPQCMYSECHPQFPSILQYNANTNDQCSFVWNSSTCQQRPTNKRIIHASLCPKDLHNEYNHRKLGCAFKVESLFQILHSKNRNCCWIQEKMHVPSKGSLVCLCTVSRPLLLSWIKSERWKRRDVSKTDQTLTSQLVFVYNSSFIFFSHLAAF